MTFRRKALRITLGTLIVYALLVATHLGEFWPFSIYPMFSQAGNPWSRAVVREMPPGTDSRGIANGLALMSAHQEQLESIDLVLRRNETVTIRKNGTINYHSVTNETRIVSADGTARTDGRTVVRDQGEITENTSRDVYYGGGPEYGTARIRQGNETTYSRVFATGEEQRPTLQYNFHGGEPTSATTVSGRDAIVFENVGVGQTGDARMVIDSRGLVHELQYRYEVNISADRQRVTRVSFDLEPRSNVTIEEPSWLDEAKNATG